MLLKLFEFYYFKYCNRLNMLDECTDDLYKLYQVMIYFFVTKFVIDMSNCMIVSFHLLLSTCWKVFVLPFFYLRIIQRSEVRQPNEPNWLKIVKPQYRRKIQLKQFLKTFQIFGTKFVLEKTLTFRHLRFISRFSERENSIDEFQVCISPFCDKSLFEESQC